VRVGRSIVTVGVLFAVALAAANGAFAATGSFSASEPDLDQIWANSVRTASDMLGPGGQQVDALGRPCQLLGGQTFIFDGVVRDRCPWIGDESVIDMTYNASDPHWDVQRWMLALFAGMQKGDGAIPASPVDGGKVVLYDYCGYWAIALHNYVLYSGDVAFASQMFGTLELLIDRWYPALMSSSGLLDNTPFDHQDYAFVHRQGNVLSYFNAQYVYVLEQAADIAGWIGANQYKVAWLARAAAVEQRFGVLWDGSSGAFVDTTADRRAHPEDGNAFAIISGIATHAQAVSALDYLTAHNALSYGNSIVDVPDWDYPSWGYQSNLRVYPFIGYYELLARFQAGLDDSAFNLIRREWGYMQTYGPTHTDWENIGPYGAGPTDLNFGGSWDAGWSSGAAAALTQYVLGVVPTSPGYATYAIRPHPGNLTWAKGSVVTPRGVLHVAWKKVTTKQKTKLAISSSLTPS
jgi:hypothetical protein